MRINQNQSDNNRKFEESAKPPTMSESIFKLRDLYGSKFDGFHHTPKTEKLRKFIDKTETIYEMEKGVEKGKKTIKE
jgi:hypothetical protein